MYIYDLHMHLCVYSCTMPGGQSTHAHLTTRRLQPREHYGHFASQPSDSPPKTSHPTHTHNYDMDTGIEPHGNTSISARTRIVINQSPSDRKQIFLKISLAQPSAHWTSCRRHARTRPAYAWCLSAPVPAQPVPPPTTFSAVHARIL